MEPQEFLNKRCKLVYLTGFVLEGIVTDINDAGITFKTAQKTAFINWHVIRDVSLVDGGY
jgi:hypothetical protein